MNKRELLLAAMAAGEGAEHSPVQVQKLLFLIDKNLGAELGERVFQFVPYDYGPFDSSLYEVLRELEQSSMATAVPTVRGWKRYTLSPAGQQLGQIILQSLPPRAAKYIAEVSGFVRKLSFAELVSAVYKAYPEMRVNSVFKG